MTAVDGWEILDVAPGALTARFDYGARPDLLAAFPFPHAVTVTATVDGTSLSVLTTIRPTADRAVPVAFGWHPYLRLPRSPRRSWRLVMPSCERLGLDERSLPTGRRTPQAATAEPIGSRTFDDLFALGDDHRLALETGRRRLTVSFDEGYPFAQVFAPPDASFVCLEPMTASTNALVTNDCPVVEPGDAYRARFTISVS